MSLKRNSRLSGEMKKVIAYIVRDQLNDPRISDMLSITDVEVTDDLRYAKVYVSVYGSRENASSTLDALNYAKGYIRREMGKQLKIRYVSELTFVLDNSIVNGIEMSKLIEKVLDDDNKGKKDD